MQKKHTQQTPLKQLTVSDATAIWQEQSGAYSRVAFIAYAAFLALISCAALGANYR